MRNYRIRQLGRIEQKDDDLAVERDEKSITGVCILRKGC